ncbi:MAG: hypothetical protein ABIE43_04940 [Patescibacteria group bacterium]
MFNKEMKLEFFKKYNSLIFTILLFALILVVRIFYLANWEMHLDADESIVGIMAKHILEGKKLPIFFYGQNYMGTLEQFTVALFFKIFYIHPLILKIVPLIYYFLSVFFLYLIVKKYIYDKAYYLLIFLIFPPLFYIIWSLKARGGHMEIIFLCTLFLYLLFKYKKYYSNHILYLLSFVAGFAIYINAYCLPFLISVIILNYFDKSINVKKLQVKERIKKIFYLIVYFIIGLFPLIMFKVLNKESFSDVLYFEFNNIAQIPNRLYHIFFNVLPVAMGGIVNLNSDISIFSISETLLVLLNISAIIFVFILYRKYFIKIICFKKQKIPKQLYFIILIPVYIIVFLFSFFPTHMFTVLQDRIFTPNARYFIIFIMVMPIVLLESFLFLKKKNKLIATILLILLLFLGFLSSAQILFSKQNFQYTTLTFKNFMRNRSYTDIINFLIKNNYKYGFADMWEQVNINFISREKVQLAAFNVFNNPKLTNRYYEYWEQSIENIDKAVYLYYDPKLNKEIENTRINIELGDYNDIEYNYEIINNFIILYPVLNNIE